MSDAPERIYLNVHPDDAEGTDFDDEGVTWCQDPINQTDIEYIRADLADPMRDAPDLQETIEALERTAREIREQSLPGWGNAIDDALTLLKAQQEQIAAHHQEIKIISNGLDEIISLLAPP